MPLLGNADAVDDTVLDIQHQWAHIQYQLPEAQREDAFEALEVVAATLVKQHPQRAEPKIWDGIVLSTWAGAKGGLGALSLVKQARHQFEGAIDIDPASLEGSALTSLGSLYYQVPGWPIGFGDEEKARELLGQALKINPEGIDSNYFYADFLLDQGDDAKARLYFEKALKAAPRPSRPVADAGRHEDIRKKLATLS
jgi:tetratricopeptide (TPR) repeat protein